MKRLAGLVVTPSMTDLLEHPGKEPTRTSALSDETARARRALIAVTALWCAIVYLNLTPTKISFLDIDLGDAKFSPAALVGLVVLYLWASFLVYGFRDWVTWYRGFVGGTKARSQEIQNREDSDTGALKALEEAKSKGFERTQSFPAKWPLFEQATSIQDIEQGLPFWKQRTRDLRHERTIWFVDMTARTVWEFLLPFACGAPVVGHLFRDVFHIIWG